MPPPEQKIAARRSAAAAVPARRNGVVKVAYGCDVARGVWD